MSEFMLIVGDRDMILSQENVSQLFQALDYDKSGNISTEVIKDLFRLRDNEDQLIENQDNDVFVDEYLQANFGEEET